jgi:hypothetical protein
MADLNPLFDILDGIQNQIYAVAQALTEAGGALMPTSPEAGTALLTAGSSVVGYAAAGVGQIATARAMVASGS